MSSDLTHHENQLARQAPITLRRCLGCDRWMRSTGPAHRRCNPCKGISPYYKQGPGSRLPLDLTLSPHGRRGGTRSARS